MNISAARTPRCRRRTSRISEGGEGKQMECGRPVGDAGFLTPSLGLRAWTCAHLPASTEARRYVGTLGSPFRLPYDDKHRISTGEHLRCAEVFSAVWSQPAYWAFFR